jgi:hypothetical protein
MTNQRGKLAYIAWGLLLGCSGSSFKSTGMEADAGSQVASGGEAGAGGAGSGNVMPAGAGTTGVSGSSGGAMPGGGGVGEAGSSQGGMGGSDPAQPSYEWCGPQEPCAAERGRCTDTYDGSQTSDDEQCYLQCRPQCPNPQSLDDRILVCALHPEIFPGVEGWCSCVCEEQP